MTLAAYAQRRDNSEPPSAYEDDEAPDWPLCADCETKLQLMNEGLFCLDCGVVEPRQKENQ